MISENDLYNDINNKEILNYLGIGKRRTSFKKMLIIFVHDGALHKKIYSSIKSQFYICHIKNLNAIKSLNI